MKTIITIIITILAALPAFARIGETEKQIATRYGKQISVHPDDTIPGAELRVYRMDEFVVAVTILKGKSVAEGYSLYAGGDLADSQIRHLLNINSAKKWQTVAIAPEDGSYSWATSDFAFLARYFNSKHMLYISSEKMLEISAGIQRAKELSRMGKF